MPKASFFSQEYQAPARESNYMKLQDGENRFRILGPALEAAELWIDGKPVRKATVNDFTAAERNAADINNMTNQKGTPKEILAFPVYNFDQKAVQILQINQVTIQRELYRLAQDEDWGDPQDYSIVINRGKTGQKVSYTVSPKPKKELPAEAQEAWAAVEPGFDISRMLTDGNPFSSEGASQSAGITEDEGQSNLDIDEI